MKISMPPSPERNPFAYGDAFIAEMKLSRP